SDTIIVFAIQILGENHAPTRTTLERCHTLLRSLGKNVLLVNTKEQYSLYGGINLYKITEGNVLKEYSKLDVYKYKGVSIPFYQPEEDMPSLSVLSGILKYIRKIKPIMIISIGNGSIVADICGSLVPHVSIGVAFSQLATSNALFSVVGKRLSEDEWLAFEEQGYLRDNIIEGTFTFDLKEKKSEFTREMYQIPEDKFALVTVGIRLDYEIDDTFIETIRRTFEFGTHIVFAGYFDNYYTYCEKYQDFKDNSTYVGYCKDILALMAICDLYVNPIRLGGGFSIIEAFHEGKPGVTVNVGDIAAASGEEFTVRDYDEMIEVIRRYVYDQEYYDLMVIKARERERVVTDSSYAMGQILSKVSNNRLFF
ncbi:MAG TPA: glycosyltransferase family 4 protein, partial [Clostridiales bacterium]|nr:glycosyltransferase family 4 protein [Clostridiales bacterium]